MCALSSNSRGVMLGRQCSPTDVIRGLLSPMSRRNLSAASTLYADKKTTCGQEGFFTRLRDIFKKPANKTKNRSHEADTPIIDRAAKFDRPKIISKQPAQGFSSNVDVVNQKLANLGTAQSMMKFEDKKHNAKDFICTNATEKLTSSQLDRVKIEQASKYANYSFSWHDPGKMHRSRKNSSMIELAVKDDTDISSYHRYYTNPRHCYRLQPQTKQASLETFILYGNISIPIRTIVSFSPSSSKPPIREPNMPEKREKKDEKKDRKDKKKPVIRTDRESIDSSESRVRMAAEDNPKGDPDTAFRYEWGVKLAEEPAEASDNDNFTEKGQRYVTKRLWGVNLKQTKPDVEDAALSTSGSPGRGTVERRNISPISEKSDLKIDETRSNVSSSLNALKEPDASSLKGTTAEYLSTPSEQTNSTLITSNFAAQQETYDASSSMSSEDLWRIMKMSPNGLKETVVIDGDYNVPEGTAIDAEITAWRNLVLTSKMPAVLAKEEFLLDDHVELDVQNLEMMSIRPEAPQPKLDIQMVKPAKSGLDIDEIKQNIPRSGSKTMETVEVKGVAGSKETHKLDSKKLHTACMQIRYIHRDVNNRANIGLFPVSFAPVGKTMQPRNPRSMSVLSTNSKDHTQERMMDGILNQRDSEQTDSKCHHEGKSNSPDAGDSLKDAKRSLRNSKVQKSSIGDKEQTNNFGKTMDTITDREMEASLNQSLYHESAFHQRQFVSPELAQRNDAFKIEDAKNTTEYFENSYSNDNYIHLQNQTNIRFNPSSTDNIPIESNTSNESKVSKEDPSAKNQKDINSDSNVEELDEYLSKNYIIDGDYVRIPGDPYPYSREHLNKWRVSRFKDLVYEPIKCDVSLCEFVAEPSTLRNTNDAYANATEGIYDSHAAAVMETSGSDDGTNTKSIRGENGFYMSSQDQRVVVDCLQHDAADALGMQQWKEAFSRLDGTTVSEKIDKVKRDNNASLRAYHQRTCCESAT